MSQFSGKYDLYDRIYMGSDNKSEIERFNEFKEKTNGKIYQKIQVEATKWNLKEIEKNNKFFKVLEEIDAKGKKHKIYSYFGKEYKNLKQLNKKEHIIVEIEIKFERIIDLVKYYPYIISTEFSNKDEIHCVISDNSYVDRLKQDYATYNLPLVSNHIFEYNKLLNDEYIRVVNNYFKEN